MQENEILADIHRVRAEHAAACGYDVARLLAEMDDDLASLRRAGWRVARVDSAAAPEPADALRETPDDPAS